MNFLGDCFKLNKLFYNILFFQATEQYNIVQDKDILALGIIWEFGVFGNSGLRHYCETYIKYSLFTRIQHIMAHLLIVKKDRASEEYLALIHRRSNYIREPSHWGIPGGGFDDDEREVIINASNKNLKSLVARRAALRETIEECGGGLAYGVSGKNISIDGIIENRHRIKCKTFRNIVIPPGIVDIANNDDTTELISPSYSNGHSNKRTSVFIYLMQPKIDSLYFDAWIPRATPRYRHEIDEGYDSSVCTYGYLWVPINDLIASPHRPIPGSHHPLCEFLKNMFQTQSQQLLQYIQKLESKCIACNNDKHTTESTPKFQSEYRTNILSNIVSTTAKAVKQGMQRGYNIITGQAYSDGSDDEMPTGPPYPASKPSSRENSSSKSHTNNSYSDDKHQHSGVHPDYNSHFHTYEGVSSYSQSKSTWNNSMESTDKYSNPSAKSSALSSGGRNGGENAPSTIDNVKECHAYIFVVKKDLVTQKDMVLVYLHRNGLETRWDIPGGKYTLDEAKVVRDHQKNPSIRSIADKRCAMRGLITQAGNGEIATSREGRRSYDLDLSQSLSAIGLSNVSFPTKQYRDVLLPPSLYQILEHSYLTRTISVNRFISILVHYIHPDIADSNHFSTHWNPRAFPAYRNFIDERFEFVNDSCPYGYSWTPLYTLIRVSNTNTSPMRGSEHRLSDILRALLVTKRDDVISHIEYLQKPIDTRVRQVASDKEMSKSNVANTGKREVPHDDVTFEKATKEMFRSPKTPSSLTLTLPVEANDDVADVKKKNVSFADDLPPYQSINSFLTAMMIVRKGAHGKMEVLLQRRSSARDVKEPLGWGFPSEQLLPDEIKMISQKLSDSNLSPDTDMLFDHNSPENIIALRAAVYNLIVQCGKGYSEEGEKVQHFSFEEYEIIQASREEALLLPRREFNQIYIPGGILRLLRTNSSFGKYMAIRPNNQSILYVYVMNPSIDGGYIADWEPAAGLPYRNRIDDTYDAHGVKNGYYWQDLQCLVDAPTAAVAQSGSGLCEFERNLFIHNADKINKNILELCCAQEKKKVISNESEEAEKGRNDRTAQYNDVEMEVKDSKITDGVAKEEVDLDLENALVDLRYDCHD